MSIYQRIWFIRVNFLIGNNSSVFSSSRRSNQPLTCMSYIRMGDGCVTDRHISIDRSNDLASFQKTSGRVLQRTNGRGGGYLLFNKLTERLYRGACRRPVDPLQKTNKHPPLSIHYMIWMKDSLGLHRYRPMSRLCCRRRKIYCLGDKISLLLHRCCLYLRVRLLLAIFCTGNNNKKWLLTLRRPKRITIIIMAIIDWPLIEAPLQPDNHSEFDLKELLNAVHHCAWR